jgi:uncharacterized protein (DUF2236 family)
MRLASRDGYFAPESVIHRIGNTPLTPFLGGGPAVLLQLAHPLVAAGVADQSRVGEDIWRRLRHTLQALYLITYGTRAEADRAGQIVQAVHRRVHGTTAMRLGRFPAGTRYSATDPDLMLWVHATLVHCSLTVYQRFIEPLTGAEQERYYQEMRVVAGIFGVPAEVLPVSLARFEQYFDGQLAGDTLTVTDPARAVADVVLAARVPVPLRLLTPGHRLACAGLLPPRLREEYGLRWTGVHDQALPLAAGWMRATTTPLLRAASHMTPLSGGGPAMTAARRRHE